jgi:hypothetical protein
MVATVPHVNHATKHFIMDESTQIWLSSVCFNRVKVHDASKLLKLLPSFGSFLIKRSSTRSWIDVV